jgi:hypothetical protein
LIVAPADVRPKQEDVEKTENAHCVATLVHWCPRFRYSVLLYSRRTNAAVTDPNVLPVPGSSLNMFTPNSLKQCDRVPQTYLTKISPEVGGVGTLASL